MVAVNGPSSECVSVPGERMALSWVRASLTLVPNNSLFHSQFIATLPKTACCLSSVITLSCSSPLFTLALVSSPAAFDGIINNSLPESNLWVGIVTMSQHLQVLKLLASKIKIVQLSLGELWIEISHYLRKTPSREAARRRGFKRILYCRNPDTLQKIGEAFRENLCEAGYCKLLR